MTKRFGGVDADGFFYKVDEAQERVRPLATRNREAWSAEEIEALSSVTDWYDVAQVEDLARELSRTVFSVYGAGKNHGLYQTAAIPETKEAVTRDVCGTCRTEKSISGGCFCE